jgi:hypothetical protein
MGIKVANAATTIDISDENATVNVTSIAKTKIVSVGMYFQENCVNGLGQSNYAYGRRTPGRTTKTIIRLTLQDETSINFDCDEVVNQATWQGCTLAKLLVAQAAIKSWLP